MKHAEIRELLPLYIDGGLDRDEVEIVEAHLAECEDCRKELEVFEANFAFLESSEEIEVPETFMGSLMQRIELERESVGTDTIDRAERAAVLNRSFEAKEGIMEKVKNVFKWRLQIPVGALSIVAVAAFILILFGPLNGFQFMNQSPQELQGDGFRKEIAYNDRTSKSDQLQEVLPNSNSRIKFSSKAPAIDGDIPAPAPSVTPEAYGLAYDQSKATANSAAVPVNVERKVIQTAYLQIEVKDIKTGSEEMMKLVSKLNGYIASSNNWIDENNQRFNSFQVRIPVRSFYTALARLEDLGEIKQRSMNGQDVTEEYIDVEARLKNLKLQEERYRAILQKASKVEDVLQVERELERVRGEVESLQNRLNYLNNQVTLSTIDVQMSEPKPITSSNVGIVRAIRESVRAMVNSIYNIIVKLGIFLPYILLLVLVYVLYRVFRRKK